MRPKIYPQNVVLKQNLIYIYIHTYIHTYTHIHILIAKFDSISDFFQDADHDLSGQTHNNPPKIRKVWFTEIYFRIGFAATIPTGQERFVAILESGTSEAHGDAKGAGPSRAMGGLTFKTSSWLGLHQGTKVPGICSWKMLASMSPSISRPSLCPHMRGKNRRFQDSIHFGGYFEDQGAHTHTNTHTNTHTHIPYTYIYK